MGATLYHGDCREILPTLATASVDAIVTDPPYELSFMGKKWDSTGIAFDPAFWREVLRVAKPGAHLLAFGGTRTSHRMVCAIEDSGWAIKDSIIWLYATGFPKNKNLLKPAHEPIVLARAPGAPGVLNIAACRLPTAEDRSRTRGTFPHSDDSWGNGHQAVSHTDPGGRWPANVLLSHTEYCELRGVKRVKGAAPNGPNGGRNTGGYGGGFSGDYPTRRHTYSDAAGMEEVEDWACHECCPVAELDRQSGIRKSGAVEHHRGAVITDNWRAREGRTDTHRWGSERAWSASEGGASRFYFVAKPSRRERDSGLPPGEHNTHSTVKPLTLMKYLIRLVSPPNGVVLDPFCGSGTTLLAAQDEGFHFIGIERDATYHALAQQRLAAVQQEVT